MTDHDFARKLARVERAVSEVERLVSDAGLDASRELLHAVSARAELVAVDGERVRVRIEGGGEESRRLLARAVERALAELAPEASITIDGVTLARRESQPFALGRLVPRREVRSP